MLKKTLAAGTIVLTLAGVGVALAQPSPDRDAARWQQTRAEDFSAFTDARIAALKAGLKLTADQEKNWPALEAAMRDLAKERADRAKANADRRAERREARKNAAENAAPRRPDFVAGLRQGADAMSARAASLKKLADAAEPLYISLDDGQKRRFAV
ncbi:MAG: Spy/CpxP family protein refolding chaperone, partial [Rhizobiales bacterium]|nr:Spy/CpxP family protein refolding chaperone [Hyphomicrobiales bacterium]